ncbi:hypothetical protein CVT25_003744 [Psilocybe cyanescens]|uniref:SWI5-dependent HO expression protein 3 n=1 Tax=Psilocybe cyanescens TaxID=93625 RepID=A0A409XW66_PSICY|nr:hypothetical protein CVT25_003744 [Psilocybe cyanescens]
MSSSPTKAPNPYPGSPPAASSYSTTTAESTLSPFKNARDRPASRSSSRTSLRTHSPSFSLDDPVSVRNHMSTLKHNIRQQQAQLNSLENIVRSGPRPYGAELQALEDSNPNYNNHPMASSSSSSASAGAGTSASPPSSYVPTSPQTTTTKIQRRSSRDVLLSLAGPESGLPLPRREPGDEPSPLHHHHHQQNGIREGIPSTFPASPTAYNKRPPSPTRTLSRNARALAEEGGPIATSRHTPAKLDPADLSAASSSTLPGLQPPASPNRRISLTPGGTTKVLADLQTGVVNARNALENTKAQLRLSQRSVAQLTRQTEDLKEGRERLRLENEGLNNVVARKERLLQEVLERARKAEGEAATLKAQLKSETTTSKKNIREMEAALAESTSLSQKSEREYLVLRDTIKAMNEAWKLDAERLRAEMAKREEKLVEEAKRVGRMYKELVEKIKKREEGGEVAKLKEEDGRLGREVDEHWRERVQEMRAEVERESQACEEANRIAKHLAEELARLRRLMRSAGRMPPSGGEEEGAEHDTRDDASETPNPPP